MLLYIIRHGMPTYDPDCLTPFGHEQAKALVARLAPLGFDKTYSSPMIRAQQTGEPTCKAIGVMPEIREFLSENALYGYLSKVMPSGKRSWCFHQDILNYKNANTLKSDKWYEIPAFEGANDLKGGYERIQKGSDEFLKELGYIREGDRYRIDNPPYERVGVFCHQGVGLTWLSHLLNIPPHIFWGSFDITHTGITVLEFRDFGTEYTVPKCLTLSDTSHIFGAGLPMKYNGILDI